MLLDVWPLGRFRALSEQKGSLKAVFYLVFDKLPFFALSVAAGIITFVLQRAAGNLMTSEKMPRVVCIANAAVSYMKYIGKMLWPVDLAVLYPHPFHHLNMYAAAVFFLLLVFISVLAVRLAARYGYIFTGWFWYLVTLLPVIGIVQVGSQAMADRYSYVPLTGIFIIAAWGISDFTAKWPYRRFILSFAAVVVLTAMSVCTRMQLRYWRDSVSLSLRATQVTMDNYVAYSNLGAAYGELGRTADTIEAFRRAIKINPDFAEAYYNLGVTYAGLDRWQEAMGAFKEAVRIRPDFAEARYNLGIIYEKLGLKQEQAAEVHKDAAEPKPEDAQTYYKLGNSYNRQGRYTEAIEALNKAVQIKPGFSDAYYNLGVNYWSLDRYEEAAEAYRQAVKADPGNVDAYFNLGMTCGRLGRLPEAIEAFRQVVGIMPNDLEAHSNLGFAYLTSGDKESARKEYEVLKTLDEQKAAQLLAAIERQ